jgi:serine/threonine protein kinase
MALVQVNLDDYEEIRRIGTGTYASVSLCEHKQTHRQYAIKTFTLTREDERYEMDFMKEISILGTLNFPSIIKFYGFSAPESNNQIRLSYVLDIADNGSLDDFLSDLVLGIPHPEFGPTERMIIIVGIAGALDYMHRRAIQHGSVLHRDLKAGNVLLDGRLRPLLADFGFAKVVTGKRPNTPRRGSWPWMAPEVMTSGDYGAKSDVYSFGMFMYVVV